MLGLYRGLVLRKESSGSEGRGEFGSKLAFALLLTLILEQAWSRLSPELWTNTLLTAGTLFTIAVISTLLFRYRSNLEVKWFCIIISTLYLTLPIWACLPLGVFALHARVNVITRYGYFSLVFSAGLVGHLVSRNGFNGDTLLALLQTYPYEAIDFIIDNIGYKFLLTLCVQIFVVSAYQLPRSSDGAILSFGPSLLVFSIAVSTLTTLLPPIKEMRRYVKDFPVLAKAPQTNAKARDIDVIFLLGESTSRWHMELYGYPYPTNPLLRARGNEVTILTDAISLHSHTVQSVSSLMLRQNTDNPLQNQSLLSALGAAGVRTKWYSTQTGFGAWDSPIREIARDASTLKYFKKTGLSLPRGLDYDLNIGKGFTADVDMVKDLILDMGVAHDKPTFWVAHFTVGHTDYCRNLPHATRREFENIQRGPRYFGDAKDETRAVNCYDSGMKLIDNLVNSVISSAEHRSRPTLIIFAPDHGEDPDGATGHSSGNHSARHIEIPVLFYLNAAAKDGMRSTQLALQKNSTNPFAFPWLHETVLDAFGLLDGNQMAQQHSVLSAKYIAQPRVVFDGTEPMYYDSNNPNDRKDYLSRARLELAAVQKGSAPKPKFVLAHRANSELAMLEAMQSFDGVETDVVFNEITSSFNIYHPPAEDVGFTLERAFEMSKARPGMKFWLDWKNASSVNISAALKEIDRLDSKYGLKDRIWIETDPMLPRIFNSPESISSKGYRHSHYLSPTSVQRSDCARNPVGQSCMQAALAASKDVQRIGATYISFDRAVEPFGLAVLKTSPNLKVLTWDLTVNASVQGLAKGLTRGAYSEVELVRMPSKFLR